MSNKSKLRSKYFEIFMVTVNTDMTLEEIGVRFNLTKQRVWQIVRFNFLGAGDYYRGYNLYTEFNNSLLRDTKLSKIERKTIMRNWLKDHNVRLIRSRDDTKITA